MDRSDLHVGRLTRAGASWWDAVTDLEAGRVAFAVVQGRHDDGLDGRVWARSRGQTELGEFEKNV